MKYTLGIDLHKRTSTWVLIDDEHNVMWKSTSVASRPHDISTAVKKLPVAPELVQVAIEPVGGWRWVTKLLEDLGMEVHIAHPEQMQLIAKSVQKNDKGDAVKLARLLRSGYFPEAHRVSDDAYALRTMLRERNFIVGLRTSVKNRIHGVATTDGLHHIKGGNPMHALGKTSIMDGDNTALQEMHRLVEDFDNRLKPFDEYVAREVKQRPHARLLMTMPGVGPITALTVLAEIGDISRFPNADKLTGFAGLVPKERSSGGTTRYGRITHKGSRYLRTALVEAAMRVNERNAPELCVFLVRVASTAGKKRARVALARKMLAIMWVMLSRTIPYDATEQTKRQSETKLISHSACNTRMSDLANSSDA